MSVVLRCPSCGTTQSALGTCEACGDAEVQYFCNNHTPGRWLAGATCPDCAASAGASAAQPAATRSLPDPPAARAPAPGRSRPAATDGPIASRPSPPRSRAAPPAPFTPARSDDDDSPPRRDLPVTAPEPPESIGLEPPAWQQLLGALLRARTATGSAFPLPARRPRPRAGGCVLRLLLLGLALFLAIAFGLFTLAHSLLQNLGNY